MNSIAPVWDGNETWLVLGGGGLLAAFPLAYAIVLPALYAPLIAMLLGLVFRGVAFEYRWRDPGHRKFGIAGFCLGSLVATFAQGITLGALLQGITVEGRAYAGGWWDWLTPFSLLTGRSLVVAYALLGAGWLIWKTEGELNARARRLAAWLLPAFLLMVGAVSLATPFLEAQYHRALVRMAGRWSSPRSCPSCSAAPRSPPGDGIRRGRDWLPFARDARPVRADPGRARHLDLARRDPRPGHHLAGGRAAFEPALHAGRRARPGPGHPRLHRLVLLGVPRQGRRARLS